MGAQEAPGGDGLQRGYGVVTATAIVIANMIGSGIFLTSGNMAALLPGSGWVLFCWLLAGLIAMCGALSYAELATRMPRAGGEYIYLKELYHPVLGFLTGWTSLIVGFSAAIALSALGFAGYMFAGVAHQLPDMTAGQIEFWSKTVAVAVVLSFTALHFVGQRLGGRVQNVLTVLKLALIVSLAIAGLMLGSGSWSNVSLNLGGRMEGMAFGAAMMMVLFAYSGWNASAYIASELRRPRFTLPVSLVVGTAAVIVIYLLVNVFIFYSAPYDQLQGQDAVVGVASRFAFPSWVGYLLEAIIGICMLSSLGAYILIGPRIYYAMARDRMFFLFAAKVHPKYKVPGWSIAIQGLLASVMVVFFNIGILLMYVGFSLSIFPLLAIAGLFIARRRGIGEDTAVRVWGYPLVPLFYIICCYSLMIFMCLDRPLESAVAILVVALGIPCYLLVRRFQRQ